MSRPFTIDEVYNYLKKFGYEFVDDHYANMEQKYIIKDSMGYYYYTSIKIIIYEHKMPQKFYINNPYTIQNIKLWMKLNNKPYLLISDKYENSGKKLKWLCLKEDCQQIFEMTFGNMRQKNRGCTYCSNRTINDTNCLATKNPQLTSEWHPTKNKNITPYNVAEKAFKSVWWKCKECGYEWKTRVQHRSNGSDCPECNNSKGEKKIKKFLDLLNINYIPQKEFDGLLGTGGGLLSYDFYLSDYNLLIEYQGEFHDGSKNIQNIQTKKQLKKQQEHDRRKRDYALSHNIKFIEIWYWDFDNINDILYRNIYS